MHNGGLNFSGTWTVLVSMNKMYAPRSLRITYPWKLFKHYLFWKVLECASHTPCIHCEGSGTHDTTGPYQLVYNTVLTLLHTKYTKHYQTIPNPFFSHLSDVKILNAQLTPRPQDGCGSNTAARSSIVNIQQIANDFSWLVV